MGSLLMIIGIISGFVFVISAILIYEYLKKAGEKVSFIWLKILMIKYANRYKEITREKTGMIGPLFYVWIISINITLVCFAVFLIFFN
ncbi:MAG: hypothetical protein ABFR36_07680 [Acidobacteriota bacterium]